MDDEMRIEYVALTELLTWPQNPKEHDMLGLGESFGRFGYVAPIIVDETTGRIVAGHGRLEALRLSWLRKDDPPRRVRVVGREWHLPVIRGIAFENEDEARAYLMADNQLTMGKGFNLALLQDNLRILREKGPEVLIGMGWNAKQLAKLTDEVATKPLPAILIEQAIQIRPAMAYVVILCQEPDEWRQLVNALGLQLVTGASAKDTEVARVMPASALLELLGSLQGGQE